MAPSRPHAATIERETTGSHAAEEIAVQNQLIRQGHYESDLLDRQVSVAIV